MANKIRSGGGINSNKRVEVPIRTGKTARNVNPGGISNLGSSIGQGSTQGHRSAAGNPSTKFFKGDYPGGSVGAQKLGNQVSAEYKEGPGGGRTIYRTGSQSGSTVTRDMSGGR